MGRFKLGAFKFRHFIFHFIFFICEFGPLSKNSVPNPRTFSFG